MSNGEPSRWQLIAVTVVAIVLIVVMVTTLTLYPIVYDYRACANEWVCVR